MVGPIVVRHGASIGAAAVVLVIRAVVTLWEAVAHSPTHVSQVIESIGILAIALVALEIAQTVMEEEVVRRSQVSAPTRVRRYLSRFLVVVVVALSIKYLVAVVRFLERLVFLHAAAVGDADKQPLVDYLAARFGPP